MIRASRMQDADRASVARWIRTGHRWISMLFIATVGANFVAMAYDAPPSWVTYSPLPPLVLLLVTGIVMLARQYLPRRARWT